MTMPRFPVPGAQVANPRQTRAEARREAAESSREAARSGQPDIARRKAQSTLEAATSRIPASTRDAVACRKGCAMCCHLRVAVMPVEVFGVVDYLRLKLSPDAHAEARERIRLAAAEVRARPGHDMFTVNIPCPLLGPDGACTVYPARPLNCRAYHSLDVGACRASFENPTDLSLGHPQSNLLANLHGGSQEGLRDSLQAGGYEITQYELATALEEALDDPGCAERHAAGEPAFTRAVRLP